MLSRLFCCFIARDKPRSLLSEPGANEYPPATTPRQPQYRDPFPSPDPRQHRVPQTLQDPLNLQKLSQPPSSTRSHSSSPPIPGHEATASDDQPTVAVTDRLADRDAASLSIREGEWVGHPPNQVSSTIPGPPRLQAPPSLFLSQTGSHDSGSDIPTISSLTGHHHGPLLPRNETGASEDRSTPIPSVKIAVMGATGSGKTQFINLASGSNLPVGMGLRSCTADVQLADEFTLEGRTVTLIDTPGFDDTSKSDTDILKLIAAFLATTYEKGSTLSGVIYIHRITDNRFTGIAGRNLKMLRELCGDTTLKNVAIVTNMWNSDSPHHVNEARENELSSEFFKPVLDRGAQMVRHHNTTQSAQDIIRRIVKNHPAVLQIQRELVDEHRDIVDTAAGKAVNQELNEQIGRYQTELKEVREGMVQALREKDEETRQELEEQATKLQEQMERIKKDSDGMAANYAKEKERMEARVIEMEQEAKRERQRAQAELTNLSLRLQDATKASAADRARLEQEVKRERERAEAESADLSRRLRDAINASVADRERLEQKLKKERERAEAEHQQQLADLNRRLQDGANASAADQARLKQEVERERERAEVELANLGRRLQDVVDSSAADRVKLEQEAKKERERAEAAYEQRLADLNRRLQDADSASAADRARFEEIRQQQAEVKENGEKIRQELEEQAKRLQEQMEKIKRDSERIALNHAAEKETKVKEMEREAKEREQELADLSRQLQDAGNTSAADRARLEEAKKEKERAEAVHQQQLADLNRRLRDTDNASAADRARLEEIRRQQAEVKKKGEKTRQELEEQAKRLQEQMEKIKRESERMALNHAAEKERVAAMVEDMIQGAERGREQVEAEYQRQLADLLQDAGNASRAHPIRSPSVSPWSPQAV